MHVAGPIARTVEDLRLSLSAMSCSDFPGKCALAVHQPFPCSQQRSIGPPNPNKAQGPNLACFSRKLLAERNSGRSDSTFLHIVRS